MIFQEPEIAGRSYKYNILLYPANGFLLTVDNPCVNPVWMAGKKPVNRSGQG